MRQAVKRYPALLLVLLLLLGACSQTGSIQPSGGSGIYYEIFVGSFYDSDGDGLGDLQGIISKLDYLNNESGEESLGVSGIWLMPINPSPSYHKYDVTDYYAIDPAYGTMEDFEQLIAECEKRGIDVIIDLVVNHSSSQHPWFLAAVDEVKTGAEPKYQNYYHFSQEKESADWYSTAGGWYYEAIFWSEMPDLNMDSQEMRDEIANIAAFWLDKGVKGFRLDAAKHIYDTREENLAFWQWFSGVCRGIKEDVFLVGEVWSGENEIYAYYGSGLDALFNFPFSGSDGIINGSVRTKDGATLASNLERFMKNIRERNPDAIHAPFLSNHDTDRSAGYIVDPHRRKLQAAIYLLMPGIPFVYYGEELGITGRGKDENKRTAMIWSLTDRTGQTENPSGALEPEPVSGGVAEMLSDPDSLLHYYRAAIALRTEFPSLQTGEVIALKAPDRQVFAVMIGEVAVLHNLSGESVEVDIQTLCPGMELGAYLSPTGKEIDANGTFILPPYASAVLKPAR
ncbi:MAG: alpha amylase [Oscillospiraceae bacterium]|jgi:glycosidase|nr:alpha amylase [Oscillospiraceae bacterium]